MVDNALPGKAALPKWKQAAKSFGMWLAVWLAVWPGRLVCLLITITMTQARFAQHYATWRT